MDFLNSKIASFMYGDAIIELVPAKMKKEENGEYTVFKTDVGDGICVSIETKSVRANAFEWVLRFKNGSTQNSDRLHSIKGMDLHIPA